MDHISKLKQHGMSSVSIWHCVNYTKTVTVLSVLCSTFIVPKWVPHSSSSKTSTLGLHLKYWLTNCRMYIDRPNPLVVIIAAQKAQSIQCHVTEMQTNIDTKYPYSGKSEQRVYWCRGDWMQIRVHEIFCRILTSFCFCTLFCHDNMES